MIRLKEAWLLGFFLIIPGLIFFFWLCDVIRKKALSKFAEERFFKSLTRNFSKDRRNIKRSVLALALFFIILAMARPQFGTKFETVYGRGVNIVIALDTSKSMLAEDFKPNRLKKAQHQIDSFINKLGGDRVGLVFFAGDAFTYCPLTMDYGTARLFLSDVEPGIIETPGTNLAKALQVSIKAFPEKQIQGQSNVIILLTDGEDHSGQAIEATKKAAQRGIKVYTIGIGSLEGALIPITDNQGRREYKKNRSGEFVQTKLDVETLQKIALEGDGQFYHSTPGEMELEQILEEISGLEKSSISNRRYRVYEDRFQIPLFIALLLLVIELLISERKSRDYIVLSPLEGGLYGSTLENKSISMKGTKPLMTFILLFFILTLFVPMVSASNEEISKLIMQGNKSLEENKSEEALECFNQAQTLDPLDKRIFYNMGRAYYKQKEYEQADKQFSEAATSSDKKLRSQALYNMGNSLFQQKKLGESVQAYTEALKDNPDDLDAKYNIELVRRIIKENAKNQKQDPQQQQQKNDQKNQDKENQDKKQGGQQQQQKDQDQKKQQAQAGDKNQDKKDQDKKEQDKDKKGDEQKEAQKEKDKEDQEKKKQAAKDQEKQENEKHDKKQAEQKKKEMSKEEAERMLDSLQDEEKQMRQQQIKSLGNPSTNIDKDW